MESSCMQQISPAAGPAGTWLHQHAHPVVKLLLQHLPGTCSSPWTGKPAVGSSSSSTAALGWFCCQVSLEDTSLSTAPPWPGVRFLQEFWGMFTASSASAAPQPLLRYLGGPWWGKTLHWLLHLRPRDSDRSLDLQFSSLGVLFPFH